MSGFAPPANRTMAGGINFTTAGSLDRERQFKGVYSVRYQKIESKIWNDEKFIELTPMQQRLWFYLLTSPHNNLIGFYVLKPGYACEDLKCLQKDFEKDLEKLITKGLIEYDKKTSVLLLKNFLKHNPITNPNQKIAVGKQLESLPNSSLLLRFRELNENLCEGLRKGLWEVLLKPETETETETEKNINKVQKISKKSNSKKTEHSLPDNFTISDDIRRWAEKHNFNHLQDHLEWFKDWARANGKRKADWDATFRNAIRGNWGKIDLSKPETKSMRRTVCQSCGRYVEKCICHKEVTQ